MADRGMLVVVCGPPKSGRSVLASDEVVPWLRKQGEGRVVLLDIGTDYHNMPTIDGDLDQGYHVCLVSGGPSLDPIARQADIVLRTDVQTTYSNRVVKNRDDIDNPWGREIPF